MFSKIIFLLKIKYINLVEEINFYMMLFVSDVVNFFNMNVNMIPKFVKTNLYGNKYRYQNVNFEYFCF